MKKYFEVPKRVPMLTLLGLIFPLGNVWGPYLAKIPKGSAAAKIRSRLALFELALTAVFFLPAVLLNVKAINSGYDTGLMGTSASIMLFLGVAVVAVAVFMAAASKNPDRI